MKVANIRFGLATNSSSRHAIVVLDRGAEPPVPIEESTRDFFGWDSFRLTETESKLKYLAAQIVDTFRHSGVDLKIAQEVVSSFFPEVDLSNGFPEVDHQSRIQLPSIHEWQEGLVAGLKNAFSHERLVVLGGNDNTPDSRAADMAWEIGPHQVLEVGKLYDRSRVRIRRDGQAWVLFDSQSGTVVRLIENPDIPYDKASAPELADLKITDYCTTGCRFCYQSSTPGGKHASVESVLRILDMLSEFGCFEVALGGGEPTEHPQFARILRHAKSINLVPNFATRSTRWLSDPVKVQEVKITQGGVGVSFHSIADLSICREIAQALNGESNRFWTFASTGNQIVAQHVLGTLSPEETCAMLEEMPGGLDILLLGYKPVGRGTSMMPHDFSEESTLDALAEALLSQHRSISVDTAIVRNLPGLLGKLNANDYMVTAEEGKFSCAIDACTNSMAASSYETEWHDLPSDREKFLRIFSRF